MRIPEPFGLTRPQPPYRSAPYRQALAMRFCGEDAVVSAHPIARTLEALKAQIAEAGYWAPEALVRASLCEQNFLGSGGEGEVFNVPGLPQYALKADHVTPAPPFALRLVVDPFPRHNFGQPIAEFRSQNTSSPHVHRLLKKQNGKPYGLPLLFSEAHLEGVKSQWRLLVGIPQEGYDRLAQDIALLNQQGYRLDPHPGNLLLDRRGNRFQIVDIEPMGSSGQESGPNSVFDIFWALLDQQKQEEALSRVDCLPTFAKALRACQRAGWNITAHPQALRVFFRNIPGFETQEPIMRFLKRIQEEERGGNPS